MKVGDLVTLSVYGANLDSIPRKFSTRYHTSYVEPIGVIVRKEEHQGYHQLSDNESVRYYIHWSTEGPSGRYHYSNYFFRNDLKFVR